MDDLLTEAVLRRVCICANTQALKPPHYQNLAKLTKYS